MRAGFQLCDHVGDDREGFAGRHVQDLATHAIDHVAAQIDHGRLDPQRRDVNAERMSAIRIDG